jgi:hypothetical protein
MSLAPINGVSGIYIHKITRPYHIQPQLSVECHRRDGWNSYQSRLHSVPWEMDSDRGG